MNSTSIYDQCPIYTSDDFLLRLVEESDAGDLLACYSDPLAVRLMNADNCTSDFHYTTLDEMEDCIRGWLHGYQHRNIVRLSILDRQKRKAIGTIEMYQKTKGTGILRLDLSSAYETREQVREILELSIQGFYAAFHIERILAKAIPEATERVSALLSCGFTPAEDHVMKPHGDYYSYSRQAARTD